MVRDMHTRFQVLNLYKEIDDLPYYNDEHVAKKYKLICGPDLPSVQVLENVTTAKLVNAVTRF